MAAPLPNFQRIALSYAPNRQVQRAYAEHIGYTGSLPMLRSEFNAALVRAAGGGSSTAANTAAAETLYSTFPWLRQLGISLKTIQGWLADGLQGDALVAAVRETEQWKVRFDGIRRPDGTLRMNEAQFLAQEDAYDRVLRQYGIDTSKYTGPSRFASFFYLDTAPDEVRDRLERIDTLRRTGRDAIDAFYVYAGLRISVDDLYRATVDPSAARGLVEAYEQAVAKSPLDYQTFIQRATEAGLERVTTALEDLRAQGVDVTEAAERVRTLAPVFAQQMTDLLASGGTAQGGASKFLSLNELLHAFEYAMIGSAASSQGLVLPERERIEQFRQAGVDRARALEAYGQYGAKRNLLSGMVQRAQLDDRFTQTDWEDAIFLRTAPATTLLEQARAREKALGRAGGVAAFRQDAGGRFVQPGLRSPLT